MSDGVELAAALLVAGPLIGIVCLFDPPFFKVWTLPREEQLVLVAAHRLAWTMANVGFTVATILTAAGLIVLAGSLELAVAPAATLTAGVVAYAIAGALWCAVLAIRTRTTPALAALVATDAPTEPAETMITALTGGLFASFIVTTGVALVAIGLSLAIGGVVSPPIGFLAALVAGLAAVGFIAYGDMLPAVLCLPTLLVGAALLLGWP